jgi:hypothetical protein
MLSGAITVGRLDAFLCNNDSSDAFWCSNGETACWQSYAAMARLLRCILVQLRRDDVDTFWCSNETAWMHSGAVIVRPLGCNLML